jgi:Spy/CpxP family protein refolding chaperone
MKRLAVATTLVLALAASAAPAQHQPYAGLQARPVKALSSEQIADLKAGNGMGLALAAELNGYPGPVHLLELADRLELSPDQRARIDAIYRSMKDDTIPLGERLITQETELDRHFASRTITEAILASSTQAIGATQAALRAAHLKYHLQTVALLTAEQISRYNELRGYGDAAQPAGHGKHRH